MLQCKTKWKKKKLGNLGYTYSGLSNKTIDDFGSGEDFIPYMNIYKNSIIKTDKFEQVKIGLNEHQNQVQCGDVFFTTSSETPDEVGLTSVLIDKIEKPLYLNSFCFGFRLNDNNEFDNKFLAYLLRGENVRFQISKMAQGSTRYNLSKTQLLEKLKLYYPEDKKEQSRIANILLGCDKVIEKTEETIEKYKQIKVGMMQDLFTRGLDENGKLRPTYAQAPDLYKYSKELDRYIPKEWNVYPVSKYIDSLEAGVSVNSNDISSMSEVAVLKTSCVSDGKFFPNENKTVIEKDINRVKINPRKDSLIISRMNTPLLVGEMGYVEHDYNLLFLPDRLWQTVKSNINFINMRFLNYLLNTEKYKKAIKEKATGTSNSMKNITKEDFLNTLLPIPKEEEQNIISKYLLQMDLKIKVEEQYLNKYKQIKQGLMKRLLTPPADAEIVEE